MKVILKFFLSIFTMDVEKKRYKLFFFYIFMSGRQLKILEIFFCRNTNTLNIVHVHIRVHCIPLYID